MLMAKIFCITSGLTGILNASFELMSRLEAVGHEVICASPKEVCEKVEAQNFSFIQLAPLVHFKAPDLPTIDGPLRKFKRFRMRWERKSRMQEKALEQLGTKHFNKILQEQAPDFVIVDVELHEYIMTTYAAKIPFVLLSQWFSLWNRPGLPPILQETIPGKGWKGSAIGLRWAWLKIKLQRKKIFLIKKI